MSNQATIETLESFIARLEQNAHAEACEEFYAPDSSMQENEPKLRRRSASAPYL